MRTTRKSTPTLFYVSLLLLAAVLCTSHLTSGLYARYATSATASDSAQVASFRVSDLVDGKEAQTLTVSAGLQPPVAGSTSDPGEDLRASTPAKYAAVMPDATRRPHIAVIICLNAWFIFLSGVR